MSIIRRIAVTGAALATFAAVPLVTSGSAGAVSYAHPALHHWFANQGGKRVVNRLINIQTKLSQDANAEAFTSTSTDCQNLRNEAEIGMNIAPIPNRGQERLWSHAMNDYAIGGAMCVQGIGDDSSDEIGQATGDFSAGTALIGQLVSELK